MHKPDIVPFYHAGITFLSKHFALLLCLVILIIIGSQTFALQNQIVGFEPGYDELSPKFHGSVSSRGLAIITKATAENGFVGYAVRYKDEQNQLHYEYFDRYPVFFSAIFNRVLALRDKLSSKIYLAKQVMNFIFVATLFVAFLLLDKLIQNKPLALAAVLITFANPYLLFYKDMIHFDQPALLGFLLVIYTIALYKIDGLRWPVYVAAPAAIAMGRGYASYAVLGLWLLIEAGLILRTKGSGWVQKLLAVMRHPSFILMVICIIWGGGLLAYNIAVEARQRNIPIMQTSIVDSANRRLSLDKTFNEENQDSINWPLYAQTEISRIIQWTSPVKWPYPDWLVSTFLLLGMFGITALVIRRLSVERRIMMVILVLSGFAWLIPLRNLAAFHDYTTMYFIGVPLAFFASLLILLKPSKDAAYYLALLGMVIYLSGLMEVRHLHISIARNVSEFTYDFMRIEKALDGKGNNIYLAGRTPYSATAEEFFLPDQYVAPLSLSDYVISWDSAYPGINLTPDNTAVYLFRKQ